MTPRWSSVVAFLCVIVIGPPSVLAADDPLPGIGRLLLGGEIAEARIEIEQARQAYAATGNKAGDAVCDLLLGLADVATNKPADARTNLERSTAKFTTLGDQFGAWMSLWTLAELERKEGSDDAALATNERAIAILTEAGGPNAHLSVESLMALGAVFGAPIGALGPMAQNPELFRPLFIRFAEVVSRDSYGAALMEKGELEKADEQLAKADESGALFGGFFDSSIAKHIGDLRRRQWRFEEAEKSYARALDASKLIANLLPIPNPWVELDIIGNLADMAMLSGRVDQALAMNDRALTIVRGSAKPKREASVLADRAELLWRAGRFGDAHTAGENALAIARKYNDDSERASILMRLGAMSLFEGAYGTAASQVQKSLEAYQKVDEPYAEAPAWIMLAEIYLALEDRESVDVALEKARALAAKSKFKMAAAMIDIIVELKKAGPGHLTSPELIKTLTAWSSLTETRSLPFDGDTPLPLWLAMASKADSGEIPPTASPLLRSMVLVNKAVLRASSGDLAGSRGLLQEALPINPNREHRAGILALIGATYWKEGKPREAINHFEKAAKVLDSFVSDVKVEELLAGFLGGSRRVYYEVLLEMLVQQGHIVEAFQCSERARARAFLQTIGNHRLKAERGGDAALVGEAEILRTQIAGWEQAANQASRADAIRIRSDLEFGRQRYKSLLNRIKVSDPEYSALTTVEPLTLDEIRADLPPQTTLISYFVSPHGVHAWVVDKAALHYALLPIDAPGLKRIVCWASQFAPRREVRSVESASRPCADAATADQAYTALIAPLREYLRNTHLILVPHNVLHYVPFAALHDAVTDHYLVDDFTLSDIPSASALRFLRAKETAIEGVALILGNPDSALPAAGSLRGAQREAVKVAERLNGTAILGAEARESLLYALGGRVDLVHIAAHAVYDPVNPLFSRIALAPGDGQDGNLEVHEILSTLDLSGVNLVVLSACETAVGECSGGDEIVGLTRALLYAGTPGVISTLWNIDDASSARLMDEFYRRFADGDAPADALRGAQLAIRRSGAYADPKYWAAFTLTGNPMARWRAAPAH